MSCPGMTTRHLVFHIHWSCLGGKACIGHPDPTRRVGKASNMLLVRADGAGGNAKRNLVIPEEHSYPGDLCTCSKMDWVPALLMDPAHSGARAVEQELPQPICHPGEAQIRRKPSITLVKEVNPPTASKKGVKQELVVPLGRGVCVGGCRAAAGKRLLM